MEAVEFCEQLGSQATKVSDIIGGKDKEVYRAIQEGIDRVNSAATSNAQRIQKWTILKKDFSVSGGELGNFSRTFVLREYYVLNDAFFVLKKPFEVLFMTLFSRSRSHNEASSPCCVGDVSQGHR